MPMTSASWANTAAQGLNPLSQLASFGSDGVLVGQSDLAMHTPRQPLLPRSVVCLQQQQHQQQQQQQQHQQHQQQQQQHQQQQQQQQRQQQQSGMFLTCSADGLIGGCAPEQCEGQLGAIAPQPLHSISAEGSLVSLTCCLRGIIHVEFVCVESTVRACL